MGLRRQHNHDALREVVEREHPRDLPGLLAQLRTGDAEQRRWAARDLMAQPAANHAQAAAALGEQLLREAQPAVRESIFTTLAGLASEASAAALLPLLRSDDAQLRNGAIEALAGMPQAVGPRIAGLLRDADPDVRIFTVNLLGELRHPQVLAWLQQVLVQEPQVNVVAAAVEVLAEVGSPEHADVLRAARQRFADDDFIGFAVDMAIERIEAP